jgi:hypothetical protein
MRVWTITRARIVIINTVQIVSLVCNTVGHPALVLLVKVIFLLLLLKNGVGDFSSLGVGEDTLREHRGCQMF